MPSTSDSVAAIFVNVGWNVSVTDDFAAWHKLLTNAVSGLMVLTMRRSGMFRRDDVLKLSRAYLEECLALARAEGANLGDDVITQILMRLRHAHPTLPPRCSAIAKRGSRTSGTSEPA